MNLDGANVVVAGGTGGVGEGIVRAFLSGELKS
jgi:NAD(P)-dependent dehydrogenase (short-subunit alcohol dehydrogenase family)